MIHLLLIVIRWSNHKAHFITERKPCVIIFTCSVHLGFFSNNNGFAQLFKLMSGWYYANAKNLQELWPDRVLIIISNLNTFFFFQIRAIWIYPLSGKASSLSKIQTPKADSFRAQLPRFFPDTLGMNFFFF